MVAHLATTLKHLSSNLGMDMSEGCFIFHFASFHLEVARTIYRIMCTEVPIKHQTSKLTDLNTNS